MYLLYFFHDKQIHAKTKECTRAHSANCQAIRKNVQHFVSQARQWGLVVWYASFFLKSILKEFSLVFFLTKEVHQVTVCQLLASFLLPLLVLE